MKVDQYIQPHFQPIVGSKDNVTYALEALFRLRGADELPPSLFKRWERSGYVTVMDRAMVRLLADTLAGQRRQVRIAVNASARTIETIPDEYFAELCRLAQVVYRVIVEVTETYPVRNVDALARFVTRCRDNGMYVAFDDCRPPHDFAQAKFVQAVKPHFLKIDGPLLAECYDTANKEPIQEVMRLARTIGAVVIAEWIDTLDKRDFAAACGATMIQGYYISKPKTLDAWTRLTGATRSSVPMPA